MVLEASAADPRNFSNAPWPADQAPPSHWPERAPAVDLHRVQVGGREEFELLRRISYDARLPGRRVTVTVPQPDGRFTSDLTSVPGWFTWLVPKSGTHLPAALVHDGLVSARGGPRTYETSDGLPVDRIDADRIFRDAMRDTDVGPVRRWVVWSAVTIASLVLGPRPPERWPGWCRAYFWLVIGVMLAAVLYLGACATAELADVTVPGLVELPWMHGPLWWELLGGLSGAVVVPMLLAVTWGRWWAAGAIAGVALATLVHVTVLLGTVALAYQLVEALLRRCRRAPLAVAGAVTVAVAVFVGRLA